MYGEGSILGSRFRIWCPHGDHLGNAFRQLGGLSNNPIGRVDRALNILQPLDRRLFVTGGNVGVPQRCLQILMAHPFLHSARGDAHHESVGAEGVAQLV